MIDDPEGKFVRWLVEVLHYPLDMYITPPPPVDLDRIADHWKAWDGWDDMTTEEAREMIHEEAGGYP